MSLLSRFWQRSATTTTKGVDHESPLVNAGLHRLALGELSKVTKSSITGGTMSRVFTQEKLNHISIVSKFRVKIGSLAAEAKIIRREERKRSIYGWVPASLRAHRIGIVREEQRAALLAYAYYRGKAYSDVEQGCKSDLPVSRIVSIMKSIAGRSGVSQSDITSWAKA